MRTKKKYAAELEKWRERYERSRQAYSAAKSEMDRRELLYGGTKTIDTVSGTASSKSATHVRNIVFENIEAEISSFVPQPKVTARRPQDVAKAKQIEDMLKNKLDLLPFEAINDITERTAYIQGGCYFVCEWDSSLSTHNAVGDVAVSSAHPKQIIPQEGIFGGIEDMDYIFIEAPQTKAYIKRKFGIDVSDENESAPEIRGVGDIDTTDEIVTLVTGYFRNENGGVGRIMFVNDILLEYLNDYRARQLSHCVKCDAVGEGKCRYCGSERFETRNEYEEILYEDIVLSDGRVISAVGSDGDYRKIPFYTPDFYPVVLRRNVSVYGSLLGDSDVERIADQQNTIKKLSTKINEKLLKGGSVLTLPADVSIETTDEEFKIARIESPDKMSMMSVFNVQADISGDLHYMSQIYEEARQILGITDSFLGRTDSTATSGKAKEFAAMQSAGRLESKRVMKNAAYSQLYEKMFKLMLAYADEPRNVVNSAPDDRNAYGEFNRYDFLEEDESGELYWNDDFLFSCDSNVPLSNDRERMWNETRQNLASGTYGNPADIDTLILFWRNMELLHYPGASEIKRYLTERGCKNEQYGKDIRGQDIQQELADSQRGIPADRI